MHDRRNSPHKTSPDPVNIRQRRTCRCKTEPFHFKGVWIYWSPSGSLMLGAYLTNPSRSTTENKTMWPFASYPELSAADVDGKTFDYVIVGGKVPPILTHPPHPPYQINPHHILLRSY